MKSSTGIIILLLIGLSGFGLCHHVTAQEPSEQSLITAWERLIRDDPKTVTFEKISEKSYAFETTRFPFKGTLQVLNTNIDEEPGSYFGDFLQGVIEVELVDLPDDFISKYSHSYTTWLQNNYLYYDQKNGQWLSTRDWQERLSSESTPVRWWSWINSSWVIFLLVLLVIFLFLSRKASGQMKRAMTAQDKALQQQQQALADQQRAIELSERSVQLSIEIRELLAKILAALERKNSNNPQLD
ncbi:hypothetical protein JXQ70_02235 [bacterium]|nr:hypothetical protein [bacterium]